MKIIKPVILELPPIIGVWTAVVRILIPSLFVLAISGSLLGFHPIIDVVALFVGGFSFLMMAGLLTELVIEILLETRGWISRKWNRNTPPYSIQEKADLPVLDKNEENSREQFYRWFRITIVVYLLMVLLSMSIAILKPLWVANLAESPAIDLVIAIVSLILQIPLTVINLTAFAQYIPDPNTTWDGIIRVLLLGVPLPFMTITAANLRFKIFRQREEVYRRFIKGNRQRRGRREGQETILTQKQRKSVILDLLLSLFIVLLMAVTYR